MIHKKRMNMNILVLESDKAVADVLNAVGANELVVVQFAGAPVTYRVIPSEEFQGQASTVQLKDLPYCLTEILPRTIVTAVANDRAVNHPSRRYLILDGQGAPLGVYIADIGGTLGPLVWRETQAVRAFDCPDCDSTASAIRGTTATLRCELNGHAFTRSDYEPA